MNVPILETERLILRENRLEDFPTHAAIWSDPRAMRFFARANYAEEDCWLRFMRNCAHWRMLGYGSWGVEDKRSGAYIGALGFFLAKRPIDIPCRDLPEAGWFLAPDFHGWGLGREGLSAVLAWADAHMAAPLTWCMIDTQNLISRRLGESAGYREIAALTYKDAPVWILTRPRGGPA